MTLIRLSIISALIAFLSGCGSEVLSPGGDVAAKTRDVLGITTALILVIVLPVMVATVIFAIRYRSGNKDSEAEYDPHFHHSVQLELLIWAAPLVIIIWLGALTWVSTHKLDPYRPLDSETQGVTDGEEPLVVQVVSMDWKWLFIYPEYGIATVNELAAPLDRPIRFDLTATQVMTAFYVPTLAGMIYTMPSMQTQLHAVINEAGEYKGMASHYNGAGFSGMNFKFYGYEQAEFDDWVEKSRDSGEVLDRDEYRELLEPSEHVPPAFYRLADTELYHDILNRCVEPGQMCMDEMMARDRAARGEESHGGGHGDGMAEDTAEADADPAGTAMAQNGQQEMDHSGMARDVDAGAN
ncbi:cytochrome o ubiquinol oxidase subunit 2 [Paracoccus isoporae]|uniref:Ubiquinol oxidase subunit 2 n=1 Tax=Paracoccus isoporae TaxID=591205 RepID=A0A1G6ULE4_9RHOB|nr:ubiquinol oxidase subunit II [Paracoccus isoporae]SDD42178.1 cytochrome o ubiquinol oxidase subunit 2 [Paracoccus isoporae]